MPDLDSALDELGRFAASPPSHQPDLGKVTTRAKARRRRRRAAVGGALAAVVVGALLVAVEPGSDDSSHLRTVDDPPTEPRVVDHPPLPAGSLISGLFGIGQVDAQSLSVVYDQPTALAFNLEDGQIVAQAADADGGLYPPSPSGPVLVLGGDGVREIAPQAGEVLQLHDGGVVDGRPTALVSSRRGGTPDDTEEELLLIDVETGDRTGLGVVGGWESGVRQARFAGSHIATLLSDGARTHLIVRSSVDGAVEWEAPESIVDANVAMTVVDDDLVVLQPRFEGDDFEPRLGLSRYALETGGLVSTDEITLDPTAGLEVAGGFCLYAESVSGTVICDQSSAAPIEIDLVTGEAWAVSGVEEGRVTLPRGHREPSTTTTIPIAGEPCPGSVTRRIDGGDPPADVLPPLADASTDVGRAQQVLDQHRDELLEQHGALFVDLGAGFGRAWAGVNGGRYATVDVDDYGLVVAVPQPADCPAGAALHRVLDGVPLFFFIGEPADRPVIPVSAQTISAAQRGAVDAFIRFAQDSNEATAGAVPFADVLAVGLGGELLRDLDAAVWANPRTWTLQLEGRWGMDGPAAALDLLESNPALTLTRDRTTSCSSEPAGAAPPAMTTFARLTLTPANIDSCLYWFAVDLFLDEGGAIAGVTVELREP